MAKLYVVPTPIGNLEDITLRAINVLKEVDFILAEDTRTTSHLLRHLGIEKPMHSHHKFNEHATVGRVAEAINNGRDVALVSDAGTPGISDPGFLLVRKCVEEGIEVVTLPGATALIPAVVQDQLLYFFRQSVPFSKPAHFHHLVFNMLIFNRFIRKSSKKKKGLQGKKRNIIIRIIIDT